MNDSDMSESWGDESDGAEDLDCSVFHDERATPDTRSRVRFRPDQLNDSDESEVIPVFKTPAANPELRTPRRRPGRNHRPVIIASTYQRNSPVSPEFKTPATHLQCSYRVLLKSTCAFLCFF